VEEVEKTFEMALAAVIKFVFHSKLFYECILFRKTLHKLRSESIVKTGTISRISILGQLSSILNNILQEC
jgi:hypothetical protein